MYKLILAALLVSLSSTAQAQFVLDRFESPEHLLRYKAPATDAPARRLYTPADPTDLEKRARDLAAVLVAQFEKVLEPVKSRPDCENPIAFAAHVKALKLSGRAADALAEGEKCLSFAPTEPPSRIQLLLEIAQAATADFKFKRAMEIYDLTTSKELASAPDFSLAVLEYANLAMKTEYQSQVPAILSRAFTGENARLAQAMLENYFLGSSPLAKEPEIEAFAAQLMKNATPRARSFLHLSQIHHLDRNRYKYDDMLLYIEKNVAEILDPSEWVDNAYSGFYHQKGPEEFRTAQIVYDAYKKFAHKYSWLPVETNTQNYSELYWDVCKDRLLQGDDYNSLHNIRNRYLLGVIDTEEALKNAAELSTEFPNRSDATDFIAHLYTRKGDDELAASKYYESTSHCSYYNRSHWGLTNIIRRKRHKAFSDYQARLELMKEETSKLPPMNGLESYIMNWEGLDTEAQLRLRYSLRFWANHIQWLSSTKKKVYIKRGFELISFVPYMSHMRDLRVHYDGDNRLWDDIRGLGGSIVIVDLEEMMDGPFGVYNLAGHEVAHQFHGSLPKVAQNCIAALYKAAKERGVFADPYSGFNEGEYFAQGVGYYMWPPDAPKRFGLNRQWLLDNDKDLDAFLDSVIKAKSVEEIVCPVKTLEP